MRTTFSEFSDHGVISPTRRQCKVLRKLGGGDLTQAGSGPGSLLRGSGTLVLLTAVRVEAL